MLSSLANSSAVIDNHEPIIDQLVLQVADLEAAGTKGIDFSIELDPCWAGFQVLRDGDTLVHQDGATVDSTSPRTSGSQQHRHRPIARN